MREFLLLRAVKRGDFEMEKFISEKERIPFTDPLLRI